MVNVVEDDDMPHTSSYDQQRQSLLQAESIKVGNEILADREQNLLKIEDDVNEISQ